MGTNKLIMDFSLKNYQKIVIKIGSSLLVEDGKIREKWLNNFALDVAKLSKENIEIIIVTSGAVALGRSLLFNNSHQKLTLAQKQACASVGQIKLMSIYHKIFEKQNLSVAQILLTASDCNARKRYLNCQNTIKTLLKLKAIAIINENDSIAVDEIKIGDNDRLASRVAQMVDADLLLLFSDIDGLYDKNPKTNKDAKFISQVNKIDSIIEKMAKGSQSKVGTGGMITKIQAAKMALDSNCSTIITSGIEDHALMKLFNGKKKFTIFSNNISKKTVIKHLTKSKKNWLSGVVNAKAELIINQRAGETLKQQKVSLLAVGVVNIKGDFSKGDVVYIKNEKGQHIASGVVNYDKKDAEKILEKNSQEIKKILGKSAKPELVHLDNLFIVS